MASVHMASRVYARCRRASGKMFGHYLLATNVSISVSLSAIGDVMQQHYELTTSNYVRREGGGGGSGTSSSVGGGTWKATRTFNMAASGLTVGVLCHYWYVWLDRRMPGRALRMVARKLVVDQLVLSPVAIALFFVTVGVLEGADVHQMRNEIVAKGYRLYLAEWFVWPLAQVINFYFMSTRFRVLYDNSISLGFDVYTSYVKHGDKDKDDVTLSSASSQSVIPGAKVQPKEATANESTPKLNDCKSEIVATLLITS